MNRRTPTCFRRTASAPRRRGVAMLLVIVALGTGVVLAGAYMTSNSTAGSVGDNASSAIKASWSAKTASDIGVAIMETELDWRTAIADGTLISNQPIAGGNVTITFQNLDGDAPSADDADVIMTVTAVVNGVESKTQKIVRLIPDANVEEAIENIADEFTVFADEALEVDSTSVVGVWSASPEANSSKIGKVGIGFADGSNFQVSSSAKVSKMGIYVSSAAASSLRTAINDVRFTTGVRLPVPLPAPPKLMPSDFDSLIYVETEIDYNGTSGNLPPGHFKRLRLRNGAVVTLNEIYGTHYAFDDLDIESGSVLVIAGNVKIRVDDDIRVSNRSAIELKTTDSTMEVWIADTLDVRDSTIGFARAIAADSGRSRYDKFKYRSPSSIRINGVYNDGRFIDNDFVPGQYVIIEDNALVSANIYAPYSEVDIRDGGTVFGRISGRRMRLTSNGAILGDPALDKGIGLTEKMGPLYKANGDPIDGLADALANVNDTAGLDAAVDGLTSTLGSVVDLVGGLLGGGGGGEPAIDVTERKRGRAIAREWPMRAFAMEIRKKNEDFLDEPDGSFLVAKADDDDDDDD